MTHEPTPADHGDLPTDEADADLDSAKPQTKTPLFEANHAGRYQRQALIKRIQARTGRRLICYVSGRDCMIDERDTVPFVDLLHNVPPAENLDLLLHTSGGDPDSAEKLMRMLQSRVESAELRIIVPDFAKSAGTLMVLGADSVVMSDVSELGPIDPQVRLSGAWLSAQNYLDAYNEHAETLEQEPQNVAAQIMLGKLDPITFKLCEVVIRRARQSAEYLLKRGMFRNGGNWSQTVSELLDTTRWLSHSQMISWRDAEDPVIGLNVEYLGYDSEIWQDYWRLYCLQHLAITEDQKIYESDYASLIIDSPAE